uniref:Mitochondria-eating protein C-terminal domain-containing protein n=1 Tax=Magallana gigas TaxID=29159 RepID=A0A8W8KVZ5_MAGGI
MKKPDFLNSAKLQIKLTEEKKEKEHALRISAQRPQDQNPEITDLSDPNRPLKLAEKVSELYDNEWTNAMENLENIDIQEDKGIKILLKIIKNVFDTCMDFGDTHLESFPDLLVLPPVIYQLQKKRVLSVKDMSSEMLKQMKDFRKLNTEHAISGLQKYFAAQRKLKIKQRVYDSCKEYIEKCVELCWMMRIQDPPIYMEADYQPNSPFDSNKMQSYTKAGKLVHFVVWPTFFFHKDGPLLAKGVVQGSKLEVAEEESSSSSADDTDDDDKYEIAPAVSSDDNKTRTDYVSDGEQSHPRNEEISNDNAPFKTKCSISDGKEELVNVAQSDTNYVNKSNDVSGCKQYIQGNDKLSSDNKEALIGAERLEYKEEGETDNDSDVKQCFQTSDKLSIANCLENDTRGENEELPKGKHPSAEHEELLIDNNYKATGKNCTDKENNINDDDDDDDGGDYKSNLCNNVLRNTSVGVHCSGNNGEEKDIENGVAAESKKEAGTRLFINDEKFIDSQCAITCDNENKSDDVSDDNQSDGGNVMFSSDINTAPYDAEYLKNDGESEDDNGSDVKQSTDINDELSNS